MRKRERLIESVLRDRPLWDVETRQSLRRRRSLWRVSTRILGLAYYLAMNDKWCCNNYHLLSQLASRTVREFIPCLIALSVRGVSHT
ncbi:MAG: hypothetical protein QNJ49_07100 [Mastigocoleus sp. MO_167.B18]|uniref:hypothetical protein n=1 Tax=Mastigocoleus sp. MO_188.B34 TaxID=3036635 RepID=UPI00262C5E24|nr:hypothetical protein [Mastigocoleus sp. MO_188.B34]MDJ0693343.1 hypothetical protein [Mastigocoleus sp. MO_188.B34]MDJ0773183.1 hypothetical protein [Mastigocoleus sp. MO_167.B18]